MSNKLPNHELFLFNCWRAGYKIQKIMDKQAIRGNFSHLTKEQTLEAFSAVLNNHWRSI